MSFKKCLCLLAVLALLACQAWALDAGKTPIITKVEIGHCLGMLETAMIEIYGSGFGEDQGTKNVQVDGTLFTANPLHRILTWNDNCLKLLNMSITPEEHVYQFAITDGSAVVSNVWSTTFPIYLDDTQPHWGAPKSKVEVLICPLQARQHQYVLRLGKYVFPILTWGPPIVAEVPEVPAGSYEVSLWRGNTLVSNKIPFKVLLPPLKPKRG